MSDRAAITTVGVVGSGAMGAGIAQVALAAGLHVVLHDNNPDALRRARDTVLAGIERMVQKGRLEPATALHLDGRLLLADELSALAPAAVVIEAIVEQLAAKQALFAALENVVAEDAVLATNTSSLSVAAIARHCQRRERVCGMHFFNPVPLMNLVEIIGAPETSELTLLAAQSLAQRFGKTTVRVQDVPGFLVNLLGRAYTTEALHIRHEGVATEAVIDRIMRDAAGFRMGPFELMDLTGIDVNFPATTFIYQGFQQDPRLRTTILHEAMFNAGRYGRKSGQGYYRYTQDTTPQVAASADASAQALRSPAQAGAASTDASVRGSASQESSGADSARKVLSAHAVEPHAGFEQLAASGLPFAVCDAADVILVSPDGEDAASVCARLGLTPQRVVAVDFLALERKFLTLMAPVGSGDIVHVFAAQLRAQGFEIAIIKDSPGFVAPRILAMIANLGCEVAQIGVAQSPEDIDLAMKLAQNYPRGPLEWAEWLGPRRVLEIMQRLQESTGSDRYRPSLWLRRRALLDLPIRTPD
jgi:3-hydroxybutyryl-CoA dehydrogenase